MHTYSAVQFALSVLAILMLWGVAIMIAIFGLVEFLGAAPMPGDPLPMTLMAAALGVSGLLLVPSAFYALMRLIRRPIPAPVSLPWFLRPTILIFLLPLVLLLGYWISLSPNFAWLALPPLQVLAIGLPVLWLLYLGARGLPLGSPQRMWGVFGSGLVLGPALILVGEVVALVVFVLIGVVVISGQPELVNQLQTLAEHLQLPNASPEMILQFLGPYLTRPAVLLAMLSFGAVVVPLIEEALKPIGVWLLVGYDLSPSAGFAAGLLSGAGYAMFESLALASDGGTWPFLVLARIGTAVIHILNTGLIGWALALAWRERRYFRLAAAYLTAVTIHGLWNGLTVLSSYASLSAAQGTSPVFPLVLQLGDAAPFGLAVLTMGAFAVLLWSNYALRRSRGPDGETEAVEASGESKEPA